MKKLLKIIFVAAVIFVLVGSYVFTGQNSGSLFNGPSDEPSTNGPTDQPPVNQ